MIFIVLIFITYSIIEMLKIFFENNLKNFLPIISALIGCFIGSVIFICFPEFRVNENFAISLLEFIISGLASTGLHQSLTHLKLGVTNKVKISKKGQERKKENVVTLKEINFNDVKNSSSQTKPTNSTDDTQTRI